MDSSLEKEDIRWKSSPGYIEKEPLSIKAEPKDYSNDEGCRTEPSDVDEKPLKSRKRKRLEIFCSFCGDSFKCRRALKRHKKTVHPAKKWNDGVLKCNTYLTEVRLYPKFHISSPSSVRYVERPTPPARRSFVTGLGTKSTNGTSVTNVRKRSPSVAIWRRTNGPNTCTSG